jgi:nicotinamidase-related amidase
MQLNPKTTALVLIDLQKGVLAMPVAPHPAAAVYDRSMRLAQRFRSAGAPVVCVRVSFSQDRADIPRSAVDQPANYASLPPGWDEFPEPPQQSDLIITKRQWGAFYGTS